jgi:hypothetical protein
MHHEIHRMQGAGMAKAQQPGDGEGNASPASASTRPGRSARVRRSARMTIGMIGALASIMKV